MDVIFGAFVAHVVSLGLGVGNIARTDKIYAVAGVGSVATCTGVAGVSTVAFGAVAALSFGFGDTFFAFGFTAFT